ncbi:MAG: glycosyltransferase family 4 protein, partial [Alphaproteobacteria bacterium]|nr:glycosyltransferase family 4 protein [Alphaproteobacteria bacterium]
MSPTPTLVMPLFLPNFDVVYGGWLGGVVYVEMVVRLLSLLDDVERPRVVIMTDADSNTPFMQGLYGSKCVVGILDAEGKPRAVKPDHFPEATGEDAAVEERIAGVLARAPTMFPVSRAMFHPYKALHWIADFQHKHLPGMFDDYELKQRDREIGIMLNSRRFVLLSSQDAAEDLRRFYPNATAKIYVWPFVSGLDVEAAAPVDPRPKYKLPEKFLFAPNQFWKHKDHITLFRGIKLLADRGINVTVACTGARGDARNPTHFQDLINFVQSAGLTDRVHYLGLVPREDLLNLFRYSAAVVQPSLFEGWSTVVEDAKAVGRPMILSDLGVHHEQSSAPNPFHFFKRGDPAHLADVIAGVWPSLAAGPDPMAETAATLARRARAKTTARAFVAIMHDMAAVTAR